MTAITVVLLAAAVIAVWCLSLLAHPIGNCPRCRGRRVHRQLFGDRIVPCRVCDSTGLHRRIGATTVHRTYWSIRDDTRRSDHLTTLEHRTTSAPPRHDAAPPHHPTDTTNPSTTDNR